MKKKVYWIGVGFAFLGLLSVLLTRCGSSSKTTTSTSAATNTSTSSGTTTRTTSAIPIPELRCGGLSCLQ